tara:strand:+ start:879 stop:1877 length:999 start_codon:yes stop_codon:yes gene_type:complete
MIKEFEEEPKLIKIEYLEPRKIFKIRKPRINLFPENVPFFSWDGYTPDIPEIDESYKFESLSLSKLLISLTDNSRCWISGETGTGKSSLVEQVAARLNWPLTRINFDSEITRSDLIGRDVLTAKSGTTESQFIDGILPQALRKPNIILLDEIDFIRPDIAYVLQSVLDDFGLRINEDGGRLVRIHPEARIVATSNTLGQGDTSAKYSGARAQSAALRDRFTIWLQKEYLHPHAEISLLKDRGFKLGITEESLFKDYIRAHRKAYKQLTVFTPLTPRSLLTVSNLVGQFKRNGIERNHAYYQALEMTVLNKSEDNDRSILEGLIQRHFPTNRN